MYDSSNTKPFVAVEPFRLERWQSHPDGFRWTEAPGTFRIFAFKVLSCPRIENTENSARQLNVALRNQKVFLESVCSVLMGKFDASVELRIQNDPKNETISIYILFRLFSPDSNPYQILPEAGGLETSMLQVLPAEFQFKPVDEQELLSIKRLPDNFDVRNIRKAIAWVPVGDALANFNSPCVPGLLPSVSLLDEVGSSTPYVAPCTGYVQWHTGNWLGLWRFLQGCRDTVMIRIAIGKLVPHAKEQAYANQLTYMLLRTYGSFLRENHNSYLSSLARFLRPSALSAFELQVAAENPATAQNIANSICGEISDGGDQQMEVVEVAPSQYRKVQRNWEFARIDFYCTPQPFDDVTCDDEARIFIARASQCVDALEASTIFRLPIADEQGLPGIANRPIKPFYQPSTDVEVTVAKHQDYLKLGRIVVNHTLQGYHLTPLNDLTRHSLIVGSTGSGKSNTTIKLIQELRARVSCLIVEPVKGEYSKKFRSDKLWKCYQLGQPFNSDDSRRKDFLRFNPLQIPSRITVAQHISFIKTCIGAAFPMYGAMPMVLEIALRRTYYDAGFKLFSYGGHSLKPWPKLSQVLDAVLKHLETVKHSDTRSALEDQFARRFENLLGGPLGECFESSSQEHLESMTRLFGLSNNKQENCVLDLESLADDAEKSLAMAFVFTMLYEHRLAGGESTLTHVTVLEEAHRLLSAQGRGGKGGSKDANQSEDSSTRAINLFVDMLAEIRAYGEGLVVVEQIPSKLVSEVVKNTNLKIMHRITSLDDREYLGESMNFDDLQKKYATNLKCGEAVLYEESLDYPVLVKIDQVKD